MIVSECSLKISKHNIKYSDRIQKGKNFNGLSRVWLDHAYLATLTYHPNILSFFNVSENHGN
jgi:hypothetical protein